MACLCTHIHLVYIYTLLCIYAYTYVYTYMYMCVCALAHLPAHLQKMMISLHTHVCTSYACIVHSAGSPCCVHAQVTRPLCAVRVCANTRVCSKVCCHNDTHLLKNAPSARTSTAHPSLTHRDEPSCPDIAGMPREDS